MTYFSNNDFGGEAYDYEDTPNFWTQRDFEKYHIEEEKERRLENGN